MDNSTEENEETLSYEEKYNRLLKKHNTSSAELKKAERELKICLSSASYRLGHLFIHETRSIKDLLKLFGRIKAIKNSRINTGQQQISDLEGPKKTATVTAGRSSFKKGISVLVPTYKGEKTIYRALLSLAQQDISPALYEVIVVINGEEDSTGQIIEQLCSEFPDLNLRVIKSRESGASLARNLAINSATFQYTVLLDDDDALSVTYLSSMYKLASEHAIVLSQIINIEEGVVDSSNPINRQVLRADQFVENAFRACPGVLTINACKLIPTAYMKLVEYDTRLGSGEDIVFFSELFSRFSFRFKIAKEALYFRYVEKNSVSRQPVSFEFNVVERLKVIDRVYRASRQTSDKEIRYFLEQKIVAQISFINIYLQESPEAYSQVLAEIEKYHFSDFPFEMLEGSTGDKTL
ncbi:MAG: glycosyltransferase family 2 protein [Gammaproteobacteria bacterium]|nr:glycosyltransferase family 2 protein [Gammaproteobacteria bacterium]